MSLDTMQTAFVNNWPVWAVTITLIVAAWIDGKQLKVPNWITFPMILCGWAYCFYAGTQNDIGPWTSLGYSLLGTMVGLALLLPAYMIGGMGAGDVKLLAGVGAWVGSYATFYGFCWSAIIGGVMAVLMVWSRAAWAKHQSQFFSIINEITTIKNPETLATIAAERKPRMFLLPYGIPIAIGCILYFACTGMLTGTN